MGRRLRLHRSLIWHLVLSGVPVCHIPALGHVQGEVGPPETAEIGVRAALPARRVQKWTDRTELPGLAAWRWAFWKV